MTTAIDTNCRKDHVNASQRVQTPPAQAQRGPEATRRVESSASRVQVDASTQTSARRGAMAREATARHAVMAQAHHATAAAHHARPAHQPTLREGAHGAAVEKLQRQLNHHGAHLTVDGAFGHHTEAAVKAFQHRHHLAADGVVGPHTHNALDASHSAHDAAPVHHHGAHGTNSVAGCANFLLHSKNVTFWTGLSTGSDRKNFERLARGDAAKVFASNHTGPSQVKPSLRMMQALVDMAKHGAIQINALTGGTHSFNSNHYSGHAVDISVAGATQHDHLSSHHGRFLSAGEISSIANRHGGARNSETSHIHLDF